jgi:hypothetical protein
MMLQNYADSVLKAFENMTKSLDNMTRYLDNTTKYPENAPIRRFYKETELNVPILRK